jgi:hypothetical protein
VKRSGTCQDCGASCVQSALRCLTCTRANQAREKMAKNTQKCFQCGRMGVYARGQCRTCARRDYCPNCGVLMSRRGRPCANCKHLRVLPKRAPGKAACSQCGNNRVLTDGVCSACRAHSQWAGETATFWLGELPITCHVLSYGTYDGEPVCTLRLPSGKLVLNTPVEGLTIEKVAA